MRAIASVILALVLIFAFSAGLFAQGQAETGAKPETKAAAPAKEKEVKNPMVLLETNQGNILLELFPKEAPISVENFLTYVRDGFYDGTVFHRVVKDFVLQAGGMNEQLQQKKQRPGIQNEATNGLKNLRGTISMARTSDINSGSSHFFINLKDNTFLDHKGTSPQEYGYAVFGKVADEPSMKVVDKIAQVAVTDKGQFKNVPVKPVIIEKAVVVGEEKEPAPEEKAVEKTEGAKKEVMKEQKKMEEQGE